MKVSIIICVYNGGRFIEEQMQSLLSQTRRPDEIILFDDNSSDDSLEKISVLLRKAVDLGIDINVIENSVNLGVRRAFNAALEFASGDIIFFCDQDDIWYADKILKYCQMFKDLDLDFVIGDADLIDENGEALNTTLWKQKGYKHRGDRFIDSPVQGIKILKHNIFTGMVTAIRKDLVEDIGIPSAEVMHDSWYIPAAICVGRRGGLIPIPLSAYRQHSSQLFGAGVGKQNTKERFLSNLGSSERQVRNLLSLSFNSSMKAPYERFILGRLWLILGRKSFYRKGGTRFRLFIISNLTSYVKYFNLNTAISDLVL